MNTKKFFVGQIVEFYTGVGNFRHKDVGNIFKIENDLYHINVSYGNYSVKHIKKFNDLKIFYLNALPQNDVQEIRTSILTALELDARKKIRLARNNNNKAVNVTINYEMRNFLNITRNFYRIKNIQITCKHSDYPIIVNGEII